MGQPLVAVGGQRPADLVRRPDQERRAAMPDAGHVAELADRRKPVEHARGRGRRLRVDPGPVKIQDLMQARLCAIRNSAAVPLLGHLIPL